MNSYFRNKQNGQLAGMVRDLKFLIYPLLLFIIFLGCDLNNSDASSKYEPVFAKDTCGSKTLVWGFPSFSYCENADMIVKYLNKRLSGAHIVVKACVNWDEYVDFLSQNKFDVTLVNGLQALEASRNGYSIFGKIIDDSQYSGIIFARKDADVKNVGDLKGKTVALAPSGMVPGTMMPMYYLYENGLNVNSDIKKVNVSSFESAIITAYVGKSEAGLCMKRSWTVYLKNHPEVLSRLELKWETSPLLNNALLVKNTTDRGVKSQLKSLFLQMHSSREGKTALNKLDITGFEKANNDTYKSMLYFKKKYDAVIH